MAFPLLAGLGLGVNALGGLGNFISGNINSRRAANVARENTDKTIAAQKYLAQYSFDRNLEMWNLQNAYNTPSSQMARFKEAGLNPNLIYGQGNAGNASGAPTFQAPDVRYNYRSRQIAKLDGLANIASYYNSLRLQEAQLSNLRQQNDQLAAQTDKTRTETKMYSIDAMNKMLGYNRGSLSYRLEKELFKYQLDSSINTLKQSEYNLQAAKYQPTINALKTVLMNKDIDYQNLRLQLYKSGFTDNDNFLTRVLGRILNSSGFDLEKTVGNLFNFK